MDTQTLERHFDRIGAQVLLEEGRRWRQERVTLDIRRDRRQESFAIRFPPARAWDLEVLDVRPAIRHLLLMTRDHDGAKHRFLCGHDERHWFVAAIPEKAKGVTNVPRAMEALKPARVRWAQTRFGLRKKERCRRRNAAYVRQGEWFFLPAPDLEVDPRRVLRREPLSRGRGSKPHVVDECYRTGGQLVFVSRLHPKGVDQETYNRLMREDRARTRYAAWTTQRRNPTVYVRGRIRHADHKTIRLRGWHRVEMNTEHRAVAMSQLVFLD